MPDAPPPFRLPPLWAAVLACLALAGALLAPNALLCQLGDNGDEGGCLGGPPGLLRWLGLSATLFALLMAAALTQPWLPASPRWRPWGLAVQITAITAGAVVATRLAGPHIDAYGVQVYATFTACACLALEYHRRGRQQEADASALQQASAGLGARLDAARAQLLQAQVEPHFLFNTLAHLRRLAHTDAPAARAMVADLRRYLDAALPDLRQTEVPLARELALVAAFLALHQRRIGPERLRLRVEVAPGLDAVVVPSTCLLTLAENAIKHGIGPQVAGGEITVSAAPDPDDPSLLRLEVADTGAGMGEASGSGTGLATLRARLAAHSPAARLSLHLNQPRGLIARVQLPWP